MDLGKINHVYEPFVIEFVCIIRATNQSWMEESWRKHVLAESLSKFEFDRHNVETE